MRIRCRGGNDWWGALHYRSDSPCVLQTRHRLEEPHDQETVVWDAAAGRELLVLPTGGLYDLAISPGGKRLATNTWTGVGHQGEARFCTVKVWDLETGRQLLALNHDQKGAVIANYRKLLFSPDGKRIINCQADLTVWDISDLD